MLNGTYDKTYQAVRSIIDAHDMHIQAAYPVGRARVSLNHGNERMNNEYD